MIARSTEPWNPLVLEVSATSLKKLIRGERAEAEVDHELPFTETACV